MVSLRVTDEGNDFGFFFFLSFYLLIMCMVDNLSWFMIISTIHLWVYKYLLTAVNLGFLDIMTHKLKISHQMIFTSSQVGFLNSLIEVCFTYHKISPVWNMHFNDFLAYLQNGSAITTIQFWNISITPKRSPCTFCSHFHSHLQPQVPTNLLSASILLPLLDNSYKH